MIKKSNDTVRVIFPIEYEEKVKNLYPIISDLIYGNGNMVMRGFISNEGGSKTELPINGSDKGKLIQLKERVEGPGVTLTLNKISTEPTSFTLNETNLVAMKSYSLHKLRQFIHPWLIDFAKGNHKDSYSNTDLYYTFELLYLATGRTFNVLNEGQEEWEIDDNHFNKTYFNTIFNRGFGYEYASIVFGLRDVILKKRIDIRELEVVITSKKHKSSYQAI